MKTTLVVLLLLCIIYSTSALLWQNIGPATNPQPVDQSKIDTINLILARMKLRWYYLDSICDPNAVFALMYLYMTVGGRDSLVNQYYENGNQMADLIYAFASRYGKAIESWVFNNRNINEDLTQVWFDDFTYATSNYSKVIENVLQSANVHINYDLALAIYQANSPTSLKTDYDRVNDMMTGLATTINTDLGARYDPSYGPSAIPLLDSLAVDALIQWRNDAWLVGQQLRSSLTSAEREIIRVALQTQTTLITNSLKSYNLGTPTNTERVSWCQAHHAPLPF